MQFAKIITEKSIDTNPPRRAVINGRVVTGQLPASYLATLDYYPLDEASEPSTPPAEGKHWEARYALSEGRVAQSWAEADDPPPAPRTWTPLSIKRACGERWPAVKAALASADIYDEFVMAQELREDDAAFARGYDWACAEYGVEVVDAVLAAAQEAGG